MDRERVFAAVAAKRRRIAALLARLAEVRDVCLPYHGLLHQDADVGVPTFDKQVGPEDRRRNGISWEGQRTTPPRPHRNPSR